MSTPKPEQWTPPAPYVLDPVAGVIRPDEPYAPHGRALSRSLESQVLGLMSRRAPYRVEALPVSGRTAPSTLAELVDATRSRCYVMDAHGTGALYSRGTYGFPDNMLGIRVPVWSGASTRTIWSSPRVNMLFRAWHDNLHLVHALEMDTDGELALARLSCALIRGKPERAVLWAELAGQILYHGAHGVFPDAQRAFVRDAIRHGLDLTITRGLYHNTQGGGA